MYLVFYESSMHFVVVDTVMAREIRHEVSPGCCKTLKRDREKSITVVQAVKSSSTSRLNPLVPT